MNPEDLLIELGLSKYEAKAYVTLLSLGEANARELSEKARIPRTKIYEVLEKLERRGFVEKQPSSPVIFRALDPNKTVGLMWKSLIEKSQKCLETLEKIKVEKSTQPSFVWMIKGRSGVEIKFREISERANELIVALFDSSFADFLKWFKNGKILLFEKIPMKVDNFRIIDRNKLQESEFFNKFLEIIEGTSFEGSKLKLCLIAVSEKESLVILKENRDLIAMNIRFPLIIFLQRSLLNVIWESFAF